MDLPLSDRNTAPVEATATPKIEYITTIPMTYTTESRKDLKRPADSLAPKIETVIGDERVNARR